MSEETTKTTTQETIGISAIQADIQKAVIVGGYIVWQVSTAVARALGAM